MNQPTIVHAFINSLDTTPDHQAIHIIENSKEEFELTYKELYHLVCQVLGGFSDRHLVFGDRVIVALDVSRELFTTYLACLFSGVIPVIVSGLKSNQSVVLSAQHLNILAKTANAKYIVISEQAQSELISALSTPVVKVDSLYQTEKSPSLSKIDREGIAQLQATSGSTGTPKLAIVRHKNITANVQAIGAAIQPHPDDKLISWLPLYHDMGLIGVSYCWYWQIPQLASDPLNFIHNPLSWLQWISRFKGTISAAPNSAFQQCVRLAKLRPPKDINLTSWRVALCGAEPVHADTITQFQNTFTPYGLAKTTIMPVYGLAEATLAVTMPKVGTPPFFERVDPDSLSNHGDYMPKFKGKLKPLNMVSVGRVISNHQIRIVDAQGESVKERTVGEIEFFGPSAVDGYWDDPQATEQLKRKDGFLRTYDLGYLANNELYVVGRLKDIIIINGRNYIPNQLEVFVENVLNSKIVPGVVAFGISDHDSKTEKLHLIIDHRLALEYNRIMLEEQVRGAVANVFGIGGTYIHWVASGHIPKTNNGKIQRHLCRKLVQNLNNLN